MSAYIDLGAFGNPIGGMSLPSNAIDSVIQRAKSQATTAAQNAYRTASSTIQTNVQKRSELISKFQKQGNMASRLLGSKVKALANQQAAEMGAAAAQGAREDTAEALKRYAPWAIGGAALFIGGIVLMRRR